MIAASVEETVEAATPSGRGRARTSTVRFILRRLALVPIIMLAVSLAVFVMIDLSPNDPAEAALGPFSTAEARAHFAAEHGLNDPFPVRYGRFLDDVVHLRLGDSAIHAASVRELMGQALPVTLQLVALATLIALVVSLLLGITAARMEGRAADRGISAIAALFQASPQFWVGLMFIQLFAVALGWLPSGGYIPMSAGFGTWFQSMIGPAIVLSLPFAAAMTRVLRAAVADELTKDYVRTAIGAGVPWRTVLVRNVLRNALITPITVLGVYVGALMSGTVLVEQVFNLPGLGSLLVSGVTESDLGVVRSVALFFAFSFVLINLLVDLAYLFLNPRAVEQGGR
ncbi:MAG: peptide/nickel transport system permease protein [Solirubrobacteraceae bacterium]